MSEKSNIYLTTQKPHRIQLQITKKIHYYCVTCDEPITIKSYQFHLDMGHTIRVIKTKITGVKRW